MMNITESDDTVSAARVGDAGCPRDSYAGIETKV